MARQTYFAYSGKTGRVALSTSNRIGGHIDGSGQPAAKRRRLDSAWAPTEEHSSSSWRCECTACCRPKSALEALPAELLDRISQTLSPNEVTCTLRLLSRTLAAHFRSHTAVQLSQPVPHHAFVRRFGRWSAVRSLPLAQRRKLIALTAASGSFENLRVVAGGPDVTQAVGTAGCALTAEVFTAAAAAGQLHVCKELYCMGCPWDTNAVEAAARRGDVRLVRAIVLSGCHWDYSRALSAAAEGGSWEVLEELIHLHESGHLWTVGEWRDYNEDGETEEEEEEERGPDEKAGGGGGSAGVRQLATPVAAARAPAPAKAFKGAAAAGATDASADAAAKAAAAAVGLSALRAMPGIRDVRFENDILLSAAYGLRLKHMAEVVVRSGAVGGRAPRQQSMLWATAEALLSPTPDWRAKAQWLLDRYTEAAAGGAGAAAAAGDDGKAADDRPVLDWSLASLFVNPSYHRGLTLPSYTADALLERLSWARRRGCCVRTPPEHVLPWADVAGMQGLFAWLLADQRAYPLSDFLSAYAFRSMICGAAQGGHVGTLQAFATEHQRALEAIGEQAVAEAAKAKRAERRARCKALGLVVSSEEGEQAEEGGAEEQVEEQQGEEQGQGQQEEPQEEADWFAEVERDAEEDVGASDGGGGGVSAQSSGPVWLPLAAKLAVKGTQLGVLRWLTAAYGAAAVLQADIWSSIEMCGHGNPVAILEFLSSQPGCPPGRLTYDQMLRAVAEEPEDVALRLLDWFRGQGEENDLQGMGQAAAEAGRVRVMVGLKASADARGGEGGLTPALLLMAVSNGHLPMTEWLLQNRCPLPMTGGSLLHKVRSCSADGLLVTAARNGDVGMLKLLWLCTDDGPDSLLSVPRSKRETLRRTLLDAACGSHCPCLPLIAFVLRATGGYVTDAGAPYGDGWKFVAARCAAAVALREDGHVAVTAAMFEYWCERLSYLVKEALDLDRAAATVDGKVQWRESLFRTSPDVGMLERLQASRKALKAAADTARACIARMKEGVWTWSLDELEAAGRKSAGQAEEEEIEEEEEAEEEEEEG